MGLPGRSLLDLTHFDCYGDVSLVVVLLLFLLLLLLLLGREYCKAETLWSRQWTCILKLC